MAAPDPVRPYGRREVGLQVDECGPRHVAGVVVGAARRSREPPADVEHHRRSRTGERSTQPRDVDEDVALSSRSWWCHAPMIPEGSGSGPSG